MRIERINIMSEKIKGASIFELATPAILLDLDKLQRNIGEVATLTRSRHKELWPMVKTHKSLEIARLQANAGATGFLCGTIAEAEMLVNQGGYPQMMLAYPVVDPANLARCLQLLRKARIIFRVDSEENAVFLNEALGKTGQKADYLIKIDTGLRRFGVEPESAGKLAQNLKRYQNINLVGIATHPGHIYSSADSGKRKKNALQALEFLHRAVESLRSFGFAVKMIATGSTPSWEYDIADDLVTHLHPGNYVFYDALQAALGTVPIERCALTVLVTVNARCPERDSACIDAGAKIFSRDTGAHEIKFLKGYGIVKDHPQVILQSLSEEVGVLDIQYEPGLKVGTKLEIVPNHSCMIGNNTSHLIGIRSGRVERSIPVNARVGI